MKETENYLKDLRLLKRGNKQVTNNDNITLGPGGNNSKFKSPMVKQNTDYLFARQLSEEMESTIVRIQPGSRASNYDKISRNSSDAHRNASDSGKQLFFGITNQDYSLKNLDNMKDISPIGEHITDEDESSKFGHIGTSKLKDYSSNVWTFKDAVEQQIDQENNEENDPNPSTPFRFTINAPIRVEVDDNNFSKIPTSFFNKVQSDSSSSDFDKRYYLVQQLSN